MQHHVYDISHCLTKGIKIRKLEKAIDPQAVKKVVHFYLTPERRRGAYCISVRDWYSTKEEAIAVANERRRRAIRAAERKIVKLEAMTFDYCLDLPTEP